MQTKNVSSVLDTRSLRRAGGLVSLLPALSAFGPQSLGGWVQELAALPGKVVEAPGVDDVIALSGGGAAAAAEQTLWRSDFFTQCMAPKLAVFKVRSLRPRQQLTLAVISHFLVVVLAMPAQLASALALAKRHLQAWQDKQRKYR